MPSKQKTPNAILAITGSTKTYDCIVFNCIFTGKDANVLKKHLWTQKDAMVKQSATLTYHQAL